MRERGHMRRPHPVIYLAELREPLIHINDGLRTQVPSLQSRHEKVTYDRDLIVVG